VGRTQKSIVMKGHAIECRVNAEDPVSFAPSPDSSPPTTRPAGVGVRIDSAAYEQYRVLPYTTRCGQADRLRGQPAGAIMRMRRALEEYIVKASRRISLFTRIADVRAVRTR